MDHKIKDGSKSSASRKKKENNNDVHKDGKKLQNGESKLGKDPYAWEDDQSPEPVTLMSEDDRKRHARNKLEKHRKDKIRGFVNQLIDLLPPILTGKKTQNTNEVLERTVNYVKELKGQNEQLMRNNGDEIQAQEIAQLRRDLEKVTNERDHLDKILEQAGMVGLNSSNLMWQKNRQCSMNAERLMKMASAHKQADDEANTTNNDDVKINNKPKRNRSGGKTLKTHINESQQNSDFVSLATARSLADQISVVTSHAGFELSGNPALVSPSDSASKLSFVDSNGMLMVSPTAAAQSLFSNVETDSTSKNYASSTGEINEEMMDATACDNNDTALQTLASLATSSQILAGSSSNSDVTMMPGAAAASMSQQGAPVSITGTQVTQSVGMPIMSTDPKSGEQTSVVGNLGFPQQQQQQQQSAPGINSNIPIPLMQQNTQQNSAASSLQGTLVMQNGQLLLIKDPVMPLQQQQQQQQTVPPDTAATDVSKTGGKDEKDSNVTDQLVASQQQQQQQAGMMFPGGLIPRPPLGQSMLNAAGQQIVPLSNGQFGIVNNAQQQSLPPTILGSHLGIQPTNQIPGLVQPPGSLPQALILPNGQVVPVVTQPNLLFPHSQSANNGIIVPGNSGALMQMPPGGAGMMPGMNLLPSASSMAGGLLMTTSVTTVTTSTVASSSCNSSMQVVSSHQMAPISTAAPSQSNATNTATTNSNRLPTTPSQMLPPIGQPMVMNPATGQPQVLVGQPQLLMNQNQLNPIGMNAFAGQNNLAMPIGQSVVPSSVSTGTDPNRKSTPVSTVAMSGNLVNAATASTSVTSGTPPVSTSSGPTTLRVVSSNGTFLITLPPGVNPQNLIIDPNNLAALQQQGKPGMIPQPATTVTGNVPVSGLSTGVGGKNKKGQRVLMPKPPNLGNGAYIPPITVWPMPMQQQQQQLQQQQQQSQQQTSEKRTNKSRQTTDGVTAATKQTDKSNDKKSNESGSGSVATDETLETDANSDNTPVTTVTEDILAKAAESIFASSMSDISPTIYDNDDNSLYIDTASTAAVTEPQTDESVAAPIAEPVEPPVVATSKKPTDKSRSRKKKSKASKEKLKCDSVEIPAATAVEVEKSVETMPSLISEPVYTTPAPLPATDCSKLGVSDEKHEKIISPSKQQQQQQPAPSMPILVPEVTNITNKQMTKQERKEARRLAKKKRAEEKHAAAAAAAANAATVVTPMVKVDADAPVAMETESDSAKENKNETKIAANEDPGQRLVSDGLPDTITFTESELCDVLDQVENLGLTLQPEEPSPPKPPAVVADTTPNKSRGRKNKSSNRDGQPVSKKRKHNNKSSSSSGAGEFDVDVQDDILPNDTGLQIDLDPPSLEINEQYASPGHVVAPGSTVNASPQIPKTSTTETSNESPQIDQQTIDEDDSAEKENSNNVDSFFDSISDMINPSPPPLTAPSLRETRASSTDIDKTTASVDNLETSLNETNLNILSSIAAEASSTLEAMEQLRKSTEDLRMPPDDKQHDHHRAESPIHMRPDSPMRIPMDTPMPPVCRSPPPRLNSPPLLQSHSMAIDSPSGLPSPPTTHHLPNQTHDNKIVKHSPVHAANNTMLSPPTSIMSPPGQNLVMKSSPASSSYTSMNPSSLQPDSQSPMSQSGGDRHRHESYGSQNMGPSSIDSALSSQHSVPSHGTSNTTALKHQSAQLATHSGLTAPFLSHSAESLFSPASAPSHRKEPMKAQEPYMDTADVPPQQQSAAPSLPPFVTKASPSKSPVRSSAGNITGNHNNNTSANNSKHSRKQQQQSGGLPSAAASQSNYYSTENLLMSNRHPDSMPPGGGMFNQPQAPPPTASANSNMQNNTACGMQRGGNENNFNMQSFMPNIASDSSCTGPFSMASTLPAFSFSLSGTSTSNPNSLPPQFPFYPLHPSISQQGEPPALNMPPFPPQQQQQQQQDNRNSSIGPPPPRPTKQSNDPHFNNSNYGSTSPRDSMRNARPNQFMEAVAPPTQGKGPQSSANDFTAMNHNRNDLNSSAPGMNAAGGPPPFIDINQPMMTGPGSSSGSRLANDMNRLPNHYTDLSHARPEMNRNRPPPQQPPAPQQVVPPPKNASRPPNMTPPASRPPASRPVEISSSHRRQSDSGPRLTEIGQSQARLSDIGQSQGPTRMDLNRSPGRVRDSSQSQKRLTEIGQPPAPPRTRSNPTTSQSPQIINSMFYPPSFPNQVSPANQMTSPPLHHPNRRPGHPGDNMRTNCPPNFHPPPPDFNPVLNFGAGGFDPPALELNVRDTPGSGGPSSTTQPNYHPPAPPQASPRTTSKANREANRAKGNTTSSSRQSPANPPAPSKSQKSRSKSKKQAANKPYEMDTNLGNSIFESGRSMTPYFHLGGMPSPPSRNIQGEGPTYLPGNLFPGGPRPLSNANSVQHKNSEMNMNPPFNSLFQTRPQNGLGLNFQPGFGMNPMHPNHPNSPSIPPHSNSLSMPPHLSNFNLNIFSDISNPGQPDSMNISPIKFPHGNPMIPPQPGMEHNALQHHHQGAIYHNRSHPQMLHNMGLFGHGHPDLTGRSMGPAGIAQFHGHGSGPAFGMPGLNFNMHEH